MFVPIRGERADGHDYYIGSFFAGGGSASFTDHPLPGEDRPLVLVKDCREALQKTVGLVPGAV